MDNDLCKCGLPSESPTKLLIKVVSTSIMTVTMLIKVVDANIRTDTDHTERARE